MDSNADNERTIDVGEYCLLLVDILNQKRELERIRTLPQTEAEKEEFIAALKNSIGKVASYRRLFDDLFRSSMEYKPPEDEGVPKALYQMMTDLMRVDIKTQVFSDTLIYYAAMWPYSGNYPMTAIHTLLSMCAATFLNTLSVGLVCRGGLNIGIAGQFFDGEIYGPALADVYSLESQVADYPRIVIGEELYKNIEVGARVAGQDVESGHIRSMAKSCSGLISTDEDGVRVLDYLGPEARRIFPDAEPLIRNAVGFVSQELETFKQQGDTKLTDRYTKLRNYLIRRRDEVWI